MPSFYYSNTNQCYSLVMTLLYVLLAFIFTFFGPGPSVAIAADVDHHCIFYAGEPGWKCGNGDCIPRDWVCDSNKQCLFPDESDETLGCNLYPETGCNSWHGRKYMKCPHSPHRCVENIETECPIENENPVDIPGLNCPPNPLSGVEQWRCNDGLCIDKLNICDGIRNCQDASDETEGCDLFLETGCRSWFGHRHISCLINQTAVCTLPELKLSGDCRGCEEDDMWRCDDGWCIKKEKVSDGIPHCPDGSDEQNLGVKWYHFVFITLGISAIGLSLSFLYRFIAYKTHYFSCGQCLKVVAVTSVVSKQENIEMTNVEGEVDTVDATLIDKEFDDEKLGISSEMILPLKLIYLLERDENWRKRSFVGKNSNVAQHLYAKVHQDPNLYRNLYHYLVYSFSTSEKLNRIIELLRLWELEFHSGSDLEVLKCWRLQLGMSDIFRHVVKSIQPPGMCNRFYEKIIFPARNFFREKRKQLPQNGIGSGIEQTYTILKIIRHALRPFLGASALYFDITKDIALSVIIYYSLTDLKKNDPIRLDEFETWLFVAIISAVILVQIVFVIISIAYSEDIFETCVHTSFRHGIWFKLVIGVLSPFMPAFILANHVYYSEKEYSMRRDLESLRLSDLPKSQRQCKTILFRKIQHTRFLSSLHRRIYSFYRVTEAAIESFTVIVVLVLTQIVCPRPNREINLLEGVQPKIGEFLTMSIADSSNGDNRMTDENFLNQLGIAQDVVFILSILYSFVMIATAFVRYVYQCKAKNVTFLGQCFLGLYFSCHAITKLTITIAIFSTAEESGESNDPEHIPPKISLFPAAILATSLFFLHFIAIFCYKFYRIEGFRNAERVEKAVHVLVNTLVVVPFMTWEVADDRISLKDETAISAEQVIVDETTVFNSTPVRSSSLNHLPATNGSDGVKCHRRSASDTMGIRIIRETVFSENSRSGSRHFELAKISRPEADKFSELTYLETDEVRAKKKKSLNFLKRKKKNTKRDENTQTHQQDFFPNLLDAFDFSDARGKILDLWWEDPTRDLSLEVCIEKFARLSTQERIETIYNDLLQKGFINRKLFNPRRTKSEYFWLFLLQLVFNLVALCIEISNGGVQTNEGIYYSWDVRLSTFFLGLVFLTLYYKRYHLLHELSSVNFCGFCWNYCPIFFCFKTDRPMQAIPHEINKFLELPERSKVDSSKVKISPKVGAKSIETQTSFVNTCCSDHTDPPDAKFIDDNSSVDSIRVLTEN